MARVFNESFIDYIRKLKRLTSIMQYSVLFVTLFKYSFITFVDLKKNESYIPRNSVTYNVVDINPAALKNTVQSVVKRVY